MLVRIEPFVVPKIVLKSLKPSWLKRLAQSRLKREKVRDDALLYMKRVDALNRIINAWNLLVTMHRPPTVFTHDCYEWLVAIRGMFTSQGDHWWYDRTCCENLALMEPILRRLDERIQDLTGEPGPSYAP